MKRPDDQPAERQFKGERCSCKSITHSAHRLVYFASLHVFLHINPILYHMILFLIHSTHSINNISLAIYVLNTHNLYYTTVVLIGKYDSFPIIIPQHSVLSTLHVYRFDESSRNFFIYSIQQIYPSLTFINIHLSFATMIGNISLPT